MENKVFRVVEYKKDGNSVKVVKKELASISGCNTMYIATSDNLTNIYKTCNGFAVSVAAVSPNFLQHYAENAHNKKVMADADNKTLIEIVLQWQLFPGLAYIKFLELSGDLSGLNKAKESRAEWLKRHEEEEQQREQEEQRKQEERKRKEQERKSALIKQAEEFFRAGRKTDAITGEMLVLLADDYGIHIHPRTAHNIYERVNFICGDLSAISYKMRGKKRAPQLQGVFALAREIKKAVEDGFYINIERVKKGLNSDKWAKDFEDIERSIKAALG